MVERPKLNGPQDAQKGRPARPQASRNRRRSLWATLRILMSLERRWRAFSASWLGSFLPGSHPPRRNHPIHALNGFQHLIEMAGV